MDKLFGLIGYPISHSWSANYFAEKFRSENIKGCHYKLFPLMEIGEFEDLIASEHDLLGLNVTIPYKEQVIPFLDQLDKSAREIGAVNTIKITQREKVVFKKGFNTDVVGFEKSLDHFNVVIPDRALILGTGGASKAVDWVLRKRGCKTIFATRARKNENQITYEDLGKTSLDDFPLIINTTPLGMHPDVDKTPGLPYHTLKSNQTLYDLIYNPAETMFLKKGKEKGCKTIGGLYMLQQQAEAAWQIWTADTVI
ncbi:MAG: shikimate dehydrogenase [Bacteroidales bacterium]|nr:shikimate dehydrogenase [Bacteroidales bacterium]